MKGVLIGAIRWYQRNISRHFGQRCRYYPSCSAYAVQAIEEQGVLRGSAMAAWRLLRCNPMSRGGVDHPHDHRLSRS